MLYEVRIDDRIVENVVDRVIHMGVSKDSLAYRVGQESSELPGQGPSTH